MSALRHTRMVLVVSMAVVTAACSGGSGTAGTSAASSALVTGSAAPAASPTAAASATASGPSGVPGSVRPSPVAVGPVWPVEPRTLAAVPAKGPSVLRSITVGTHGTFERIVLQFTAAYGATRVWLVPVVRADPSNAVVPLAGSAFLTVVVQQAAARWPVQGVVPYQGASTLKPGYPTVKQVSISGDYEAVLSIGIGLDRTTGFQVERLQSPDRLVVDVAELPSWRMWPDDSHAAAVAAQAGFDQGHQSWRGGGASVAWSYGFAVYGWTSPIVTAVDGAGTYRISQRGSTDHVTVRAVAAFPGRSHSIFEIIDSR
jgi:hypothetical protein